MPHSPDLLATFHAAITHEAGDAPWRALQALAQETVGAKLFTAMEVDMAADLARRSYSSDPDAYPVSGSKPINRTHWFETIHTRREPFVANTLAAIADVFPDHALIGSLGLGSVINLPIVVAGELVGTLNLLDVPGHYTPERVALAQANLTAPAQVAFLAAAWQRLSTPPRLG